MSDHFQPPGDPGSVSSHIRRLAGLAGPVVLTQLGTMALGVVDMIMLGHVGVAELASASLGLVWLHGTLIFGIGFAFGLDPLFSQAFGRGNRQELSAVLWQGLIAVTIVSLPLSVSWWFTEEVMLLAGQDAELAKSADQYVRVQAWSTAPLLIYLTFRGYLQGQNIVSPCLWLMLVANAFNVAANWALIYGNLGFPMLGIEGAGTASSLTRLFLAVGICLLIAPVLRARAIEPIGRSLGFAAAMRQLSLRRIQRLVGFAAPVGIQYSLEVWAFQAATLVAGLLGTVELAAHTVALNVASVTYMIPLGMSIAVAAIVGNAIGEGNDRKALRAGWVALGAVAIVMSVTGVLVYVAKDDLPAIWTDNVPVAVLAASVLPIAAAFQVFDGIQAVAGGILRGMGSASIVAAFNFAGYYVFAIPLGWWLRIERGWGLPGIWWSFVAGLAIVALTATGWIAHRGVTAIRRPDGI